MIPPPPVAVRSDDLLLAGADSRELRRLAEHGTMTRIVPGAYVDSLTWRSLKPRDQYALIVRERVRRLASPVVVSHWSAAVVHAFPVPDDWPDEVQVIDPRRGTANRIPSLLRRPGVVCADDVVSWEGLSVTSPARTAADLILVCDFDAAVMLLDHGLRVGAFTKDMMSGLLDLRPHARRRRSARAALDFADARAEYPGESYSRVAMATRGIATPVLQQEFTDAQGEIGRVDFWWPEVGIAGEFDGEWKYTDERFTRGRSPMEVLRDEKRRQARLDAHPAVKRTLRWPYSVARSPDELARRLRAGGVPDRRAKRA